MDKNNDIQVNKVDKWCEGVADVSLLRAKKSVDMFLSCYSPILSIEALDAVRTIYVALDEALDRFNELEAKYQEACGMISQYEEENRTLQKQRKKLANANNKVAEDNHNLRRERDRHIDLLDKLRWALEDKGICCEWNERALKWNLYDNANICESCKKHFEDELRIRCEELGEKDKLIDELRQKIVELEPVLDDYNELEARHQKDTGMISEYEEENKKLKSELDIKTDECDALISRVFEQDKEYTKLKEGLYEVKKEKEDLVKKYAELEKENTFNKKMHTEYCDIIEARLNQQYHNRFNDLKSKCESKENALQKMIQEVTELEKEKIDLEDLLVNQKRLEAKARVNASTASTYKSEIKQIIELAKSYGVIIHDDRKDAKSDDAINISMCGHYYILDGHNKEESKDIQKLKDKIETLEKENKDLKDTIEKDEEFGRYVGERISDSIREGCDKGIYKLHPYMRIDIHVEETNSMPIDMPFGRYAIPRISVMFNNTQTEMERDTAEHECEELNEKIDIIWRANDELNRKIKGLEKENKDLKQILERCEWDANAARNLCHNIAFNAERARNNIP